jgi:hypothetical protein
MCANGRLELEHTLDKHTIVQQHGIRFRQETSPFPVQFAELELQQQDYCWRGLRHHIHRLVLSPITYLSRVMVAKLQAEGASFVSSKGKGLEDITVIEIWPGSSRDSTTVVKAPSRIAYPDDNDRQRIKSKQWGYQVQPGMTAFSWTKLLLDQNAPLTKYDDPGLEKASEMGILRLPEGKTATDVVSDYLSGVYEHILLRIAKQITEDTLRTTPLEFWFTVPAIWSDQAQNATINAARRAGFGSSISRPNDEIFLISEPEAAAITSLKKYTTNGIGKNVQVGFCLIAMFLANHILSIAR